MLSKYKIENVPEVVEVIKVDQLQDLVKNNGFLVIRVDTDVPEVLNHLVDLLGVNEFQFPTIVIDTATTLYEVLEAIEEDKITEDQKKLKQWQQYAGYCNCCAKSGEHNIQEFEEFTELKKKDAK